MSNQSTRVTLFPGDWIGPELVEVMNEVVEAAGASITWERFEAGHTTWERGEGTVPEAAFESLRSTRVGFKAKHMTPTEVGQFENPAVALRKELNLFANVRLLRALPGLEARWPELDVVVIRESTEDIYAGIEHEVKAGMFESLKVTTRAACERIAHFAFRYAREHGRKKVTIVHKANIMKLSDGMFMRTAKAVGAEYPDIEHETIIADNMCMQLVQRPHRFDVILAANLFGDIISDLGAGLVGGISAVPGINLGDDIALFECFHGKVPELVGTDLANPIPMLMPAIQLLRHIGEDAAADRIQAGITHALEAGVKTRDLGGTARTSEVKAAIIAGMGA